MNRSTATAWAIQDQFVSNEAPVEDVLFGYVSVEEEEFYAADQAVLARWGLDRDPDGACSSLTLWSGLG